MNSDNYKVANLERANDEKVIWPMKMFFAKFFFTVGVLTVMFIVAMAGMVLFFRFKAKAVPSNTVLFADFERNYIESAPSDNPLARLSLRETPRMFDLVAALKRAGEDKRVRLLIAKIGASGMKTAKIQEIRDAVMRFRGKGKKAIAFAETFGEFGPGNNAYYLATAFDEIYLQPSGGIGLTGMSTKTPFVREFLDTIGVKPSLEKRKEYKSAAYTFTESGYTAPHREADMAVLESILSRIVDDVAEARGLEREKVLSLVARGPFTAREALDEKLVDGLLYRDQLFDKIRERTGEDARQLSFSAYLNRAGSPYAGGTKVALIHGVGQIVRGESNYLPLGGHMMGSDTVAKAFRQAVDDKSVKAIIFRINSPGGSYVASDTVWREVVRAREKGKPVIATMSGVAGSGGYFVAMAADRIIAHPGTITGSIGVVNGKMVTSEMWQKVGVQWGELFTHDNAAMWSGTERYTEAHLETIQKWLDGVYKDFVTKAAQGRGMDYETLEEFARGRIWTGEDARARGLVDELGGFAAAFDAARKSANIPEGRAVGVKLFPKKRPLWKRLLYGDSKRREIRYAFGLEMLAEADGPLADELRRLVRETDVVERGGILRIRELAVE